MPLVSIIVPVYKVEKYLDECVQSIVSQTLADIEIILVDDGSPDNCPQMCDDWAKKDSRVKVIHQENGGLAVARNAGIKAATSKYIAFVDSDDWAEKDMIKTLYDAITAANADLVQCGFNTVINNEKRHNNTEAFEYNKEDIKSIVIPAFYKNEPLKAKIYPSRCNKMYLKDKLIDSIKLCPSDLQSGEDYVLNTAYVFLCKKIISIDKGCFYNYRYNNNSLTTIYAPRYRQSIEIFFSTLKKISDYYNTTCPDMSAEKDFSYCNAIIFALVSKMDTKDKINEINQLKMRIENKFNILQFSKKVNLKQKIALLLIFLNFTKLTVEIVSILKQGGIVCRE